MSNEGIFKAPADQVDLEAVKAKFTNSDGSVNMDEVWKKIGHQDKHISTLEGETANLRQDLTSRITYEDLVDKLSTVNAASNDRSDQTIHERDKNPQITEELLNQKVEDLFNQKQQEATQVANLTYAAQELVKMFGTDYVPSLKARTQELHLNEAYIDNLAKTNPRALLAIVASSRTADTSYVPPQTRVNSTANGSSNGTVKNWKYYEQLAKTDPKRYEATVKERYDQAMAMGEAFYQ